MTSPLLHVGATLICAHSGQVSIVSTNARVFVGGQPAATLGDTFLIGGCPFTVPGPKPQPCVKVQWLAPAARVFVNGQPAIVQASAGLCQSAGQIPQGAPLSVAAQVRVRGI
ncbi:MAG TPA: hypothetical protein VJG32_09750 [Anaerolineae bacterium]|nr:hypothetical protein [Anaerolineae bacterium]